MIKYEDVCGESTSAYFNGNQFSIDAFNKKYRINDDETYVQAIKRVCDFVASVESTKELREYWSERWFDEIYNDWWHPAGSIMQGAGSGKKISLGNCFSSDTTFITDKGVKSFLDFKNGDQVNILSNYGSFKTATIKYFGKQKIGCLTLKKRNITKVIKVTPQHNWRTLNKESIIEKITENLKPGDIIPYIKRRYVDNRNGSRYYCPIGFIHGLVFGDGSYDKRTDTCSLDLCGDSRQYIKFFKSLPWNHYPDNNANKDKIRYLPNYMKNLPSETCNSEYLLGFIIGWFAADGTIDKDGRTYLYHNNKENLQWIKNKIEALGIYTSDIKNIRDTDSIVIQNKTYSNKQYQLYSLYFLKDCLFESFFTKESHLTNYKNACKTIVNKINWTVVSYILFDDYEDVWCVVEPEQHNFTLSGGVNTGNCNTISLGTRRDDEEWDNLESIIKNTAYTVAKSAAYRQGVGIDFSRLRPSGTTILNSARNSTGPVHWMGFIDSIGNYVGQYGRIPAMLLSLSIEHPDIEKFITVKADHGVIQNANISVQAINKFYEAVLKNKDFELKFEIPEVKAGDKVYIHKESRTSDSHLEYGTGKYYYVATHDKPAEIIKKKISAVKLLELLAQNMTEHAEPGIQNIDIARYWSNSDYLYDPNANYDSRIISTNACSEQYLSLDSLCILISQNMEKFSTDPEEYEKELAEICPSMNRFADNVNECELRYKTYATDNQKLAIESLRRTGAGVTGLHGWITKCGDQYGDKKSIAKTSHFIERFNYYLYKSSINLGREKGSFGLFNRKKLEQSPFIQHMMDLGLKFTHLRNVTCSSIAPTGTLTLMFRNMLLSYGVEPAFNLYFWKRTRIEGNWTYYFCVPNVVRKIYENAGYKIPIDSDTIADTIDGKFGSPIAQFIDAHQDDVGIRINKSTEVDIFDKLKLMSALMKNIDSSISTTYMLPENADWHDTYNFILETYKAGVKSVTTYQDKKLYGVVSFIPFKELALDLIKNNIKIHTSNFSDEEFVEIFGHSKTIDKNDRPKELQCDVYHISVKGTEYFVLVGLWSDGTPYEVFAGKNGCVNKKIKKGKIIRKKKNFYKFEDEDGDTELAPITAVMSDMEESISRLTSGLLRCGADMNFIVGQLEKVGGDTELHNFGKCLARSLKKYIIDNTLVGAKCPDCGAELVRISGCPTCVCGYSKCN